MNTKNLNLEELEPVDFKVDKNAFAEKDSVVCCGKKVKKQYIDYVLPQTPIKIKLGVFRCPKCKEELMDFPNAELLEKALEFKRVLMNEQGFRMKRKCSFDGSNFLLRIPTDFTSGFEKGHLSAMLNPIKNDEFVVKLVK